MNLAFDAANSSTNMPFSDSILLPFPIAYQLGLAFTLNEKLRKYSKSGNKVPAVCKSENKVFNRKG